MGQYNGAVITTAGQAVLAQAIGGAELTITKVVTSATAIPPGTDLTALTTIADVKQTEQPTSVQVFNDNIVQISTRFSNAGVAAAYLIQTLGVFGQVTGGAETLLAVSTAVTPDQMPAEDSIAPSAFIYNMQLTVQSADQITVTVNDAGTATVADVRALGELIDSKIGSLADLSTDNKDSLVNAINEVFSSVEANADNISGSNDLYNSTKNYVIGDYVIHDGVLYECITDCSAGPWGINQSCFSRSTMVKLGNELITGLRPKSYTFGIDKITSSTGSIDASSIVNICVTEHSLSCSYYIRVKDPNGRPTITVLDFPVIPSSFLIPGNPSPALINGVSEITDNCYITLVSGRPTMAIYFYNYIGNFPSGSGALVASGSFTVFF